MSKKQVEKQKVAVKASAKKPRKAKAADGAAAGKTYFHKLPGGAAVIVHHTAGKTGAEVAKEMTAYAEKTIALCASILRLAEKRMDAGLEKINALDVYGRDVTKATKAAHAIFALCGAAEHVKGMM
jgi:hypothetical protein